jgi:ferredoxin--NADP+ reductase
MDPEVAAARNIPLNLYKNVAPLQVVVRSNVRLTGPQSPNDVRHIVLEWAPGAFHFLDGQAAGIPPPGLNARGRPNVPRLYSIASPGVGELDQPHTLALCVKRVVWIDEHGVVQRGLASNHLCDAQPGDVLRMTGPAGKDFLGPQDPTGPMVMIATGTGIAPFRAFLHTWRKRPRAERGPAWLVFGCQTSADLLYDDEWQALRQEPDFRVDYAISREQTTMDGRRMYVQDRLRALGGDLWACVSAANANVYICGLKGMETGIDDALTELAAAAGRDWTTLRDEMRDAERWHVEVY